MTHHIECVQVPGGVIVREETRLVHLVLAVRYRFIPRVIPASCK
jgi:hypothetical protein